ncbi:hypothetical protein TNCV_1033241 [Trichonephila clavipes]|nr:hypothetical protein TNCV_1033241 [Trichonephila clavipes]
MYSEGIWWRRATEPKPSGLESDALTTRLPMAYLNGYKEKKPREGKTGGSPKRRRMKRTKAMIFFPFWMMRVIHQDSSSPKLHFKHAKERIHHGISCKTNGGEPRLLVEHVTAAFN